MSLEANKVVTFNFTLKDENGQTLDSTMNDGPYTFLTGYSQVFFIW
jgi:FKBP-type peptidyl-prolyl cis-trans isomerase 2